MELITLFYFCSWCFLLNGLDLCFLSFSLANLKPAMILFLSYFLSVRILIQIESNHHEGVTDVFFVISAAVRSVCFSKCLKSSSSAYKFFSTDTYSHLWIILDIIWYYKHEAWIINMYMYSFCFNFCFLLLIVFSFSCVFRFCFVNFPFRWILVVHFSRALCRWNWAIPVLNTSVITRAL